MNSRRADFEDTVVLQRREFRDELAARRALAQQVAAAEAEQDRWLSTLGERQQHRAEVQKHGMRADQVILILALVVVFLLMAGGMQ